MTRVVVLNLAFFGVASLIRWWLAREPDDDADDEFRFRPGAPIVDESHRDHYVYITMTNGEWHETLKDVYAKAYPVEPNP